MYLASVLIHILIVCLFHLIEIHIFLLYVHILKYRTVVTSPDSSLMGGNLLKYSGKEILIPLCLSQMLLHLKQIKYEHLIASLCYQNKGANLTLSNTSKELKKMRKYTSVPGKCIIQ